MRSAHLMIVVVAAALVVGACSSSSSTPAPTTGPTAAASAGAGASSDVSIKDFAFNPATSTAKVGGQVNWTNNDSTAHTVTFDDSSVKSSGNVDAGGKFSTTFSKAGSFAYHCTIHSNMQGTVTVS